MLLDAGGIASSSSLTTVFLPHFPPAQLMMSAIIEVEMAPDNTVSATDRRLEELGYRPQFKRDMSLFGVLGMSFCAIGILTGMSSAFQTGMFSGGPLGLFWGWNVCGIISTLVRAIDSSFEKDLQLLHVLDCSMPR